MGLGRIWEKFHEGRKGKGPRRRLRRYGNDIDIHGCFGSIAKSDGTEMELKWDGIGDLASV